MSNNQPAVQRPTQGLRDALFDELEALRRGDSTPTKANGIAKLCSTLLDTHRVELQLKRYSTPNE